MWNPPRFVTLESQISSQNDTAMLFSFESARNRMLQWKVSPWSDVQPDYLKNKSSTTQSLSSITRVMATIGNNTKVDVLGNPINSGLIQRRTSCSGCFKHDFKYVIANDRVCKVFNGQGIDLVVVILTVHQNVEARNAVRETWMSPWVNNTLNVRYVFLLGETKDEKLRQSVMNESLIHDDILKEDFVDAYSNLTYKTIMGFKWVSTHCAHAHYVMKTDDDMFVNIPKLLDTLRTIGNETLHRTVIGTCHMVGSPIRNTKSKWYASINSYPEKTYPGFCSGTGYVTSVNVARKVYEISPSVPFFHLEDVYTSLCVSKLNYTLRNTAGFHADKPPGDGCVYKAKYITAHYISPVVMRQIWDKQCT